MPFVGRASAGYTVQFADEHAHGRLSDADSAVRQGVWVVQINISTRHGQLSDATRAKITAKVEKLARLFERLTAIEVTVDLEHADIPVVDLRVAAEHKHDFIANEQAESLMAALDGTIHKIEQQLRKYKEKVVDRHRTTSAKEQTLFVEPEGE